MTNNKVRYKTIIETEEQNIEIYPTDMEDGIIVEIKEIDGTGNSKLYLNKDERHVFSLKMKEMMDYIMSE